MCERVKTQMQPTTELASLSPVIASRWVQTTVLLVSWKCSCLVVQAAVESVRVVALVLDCPFQTCWKEILAPPRTQVGPGSSKLIGPMEVTPGFRESRKSSSNCWEVIPGLPEGYPHNRDAIT